MNDWNAQLEQDATAFTNAAVRCDSIDSFWSEYFQRMLFLLTVGPTGLESGIHIFETIKWISQHWLIRFNGSFLHRRSSEGQW